MLIHHDPSEWEAVSERRTCEFHKRNPFVRNYPGCTCSSMYGLRRRKRRRAARPCPEPGCPIPQDEPMAPPAACRCPMHLYVPPGRHVHVDCPVHGKRVIRGSQVMFAAAR